MYIRIKTTPNSPRRSVQIVKSCRDSNGKVKQKIVRHVGVARNDKELERLQDLAEFIKSELEAEHQPSLWSPDEVAAQIIACRKEKESKGELKVDLKKLREEQRIVVGIHEVYGKMYELLGFDRILGRSQRNKTSSEILKHIVMARIANPSSKRDTIHFLEKDFGVNISLDKVYRMMDKIDDKIIDKIQKGAYLSTKTILSEKINVLFYDCTTLYFESFTEDELKSCGYSKDFKFNQPQVILALLATEEGLPVGYEVFPGSSFEGHTLIPILKKLKENYELNKIIFVADRGMVSRDNLQYLDEEGFDYIVGARIKNLPKNIREEILNDANYKIEQKEGMINKTGNFELSGEQRLIVNYCSKRAKKDRKDREKSIQKLLKKISKSGKDPKSLLNNYGYKKYLELEGSAKLKINEEKIKQDEAWDGLLGITTNIKDKSNESLLMHYRSLWQIEECFRITKHDLKIRPIFHWTPSRIKAHIAIVFMAFTCIKHLSYRVGIQVEKLSIETIRRELVRVQLSILKHIQTGKKYAMPSNISKEAKSIYQAMGIKLSMTPFEMAS